MNVKESADPHGAERKTTDLCGDQVHVGIRCMRPKHHEGDHECYRVAGTPVRWR
jgi:hypothetical protein